MRSGLRVEGGSPPRTKTLECRAHSHEVSSAKRHGSHAAGGMLASGWFSFDAGCRGRCARGFCARPRPSRLRPWLCGDRSRRSASTRTAALVSRPDRCVRCITPGKASARASSGAPAPIRAPRCWRCRAVSASRRRPRRCSFDPPSTSRSLSCHPRPSPAPLVPNHRLRARSTSTTRALAGPSQLGAGCLC